MGPPRVCSKRPRPEPLSPCPPCRAAGRVSHPAAPARRHGSASGSTRRRLIAPSVESAPAEQRAVEEAVTEEMTPRERPAKENTTMKEGASDEGDRTGKVPACVQRVVVAVSVGNGVHRLDRVSPSVPRIVAFAVLTDVGRDPCEVLNHRLT